MKKSIIGVFLFLLLLLLSPGIASAGETQTETIRVPREALLELRTTYQNLEMDNKKLEKISKEQMNQLLTSQRSLTEAKKQLMQLNNQLKILTELSSIQEQKLKEVNESFKTYSKEQEKTKKRLAMQRNIAYGLLGATVIYFVAKH